MSAPGGMELRGALEVLREHRVPGDGMLAAMGTGRGWGGLGAVRRLY